MVTGCSKGLSCAQTYWLKLIPQDCSKLGGVLQLLQQLVVMSNVTTGIARDALSFNIVPVVLNRCSG